MAIALLTFGRLVERLRSLVQWLTPPPSVPCRRPEGQRAASFGVARAQLPRRESTSGRPLRVVRVVEATRAPAGAGRMFMSGRMADVCAELERLAALEAAAG